MRAVFLMALHAFEIMVACRLQKKTQPYNAFESKILSLASAARKREYNKDWEALFEIYPTLTAKEFDPHEACLVRKANNSLMCLQQKINYKNSLLKKRFYQKIKN